VTRSTRRFRSGAIPREWFASTLIDLVLGSRVQVNSLPALLFLESDVNGLGREAKPMTTVNASWRLEMLWKVSGLTWPSFRRWVERARRAGQGFAPDTLRSLKANQAPQMMTWSDRHSFFRVEDRKYRRSRKILW